MNEALRQEEARQNQLERELTVIVLKQMKALGWCGLTTEGAISGLASVIAWINIKGRFAEQHRKAVRDALPELVEMHERLIEARLQQSK